LKTYREGPLNNRHNLQANSIKFIKKKYFRKEKEILTCPVERHKSRKKKKNTFECQTGFKTIQCSECWRNRNMKKRRRNHRISVVSTT
jgi:hypothetical protein